MQRDGVVYSIPTPPEGWISLQELLARTGVSERNLSEWRRLDLGVPEPNQISLGRRGTASYYPIETVRLINRLNELRQEIRDADEWLWRLWLEDFKIDICVWVKKRLSKPRRSDLQRLICNRVRKSADRAALISWAADIAAGRVQQASLYNAEPPIFEILLRAGGLPGFKRAFYGSGPVPDRELRVEEMSAYRLRDIMDSASDAELEQAQRDWQAFAGLAEAAEAVDWGAASPAIELAIKSLFGSGMPPSLAERRARRTRPVPPSGIVTLLLALWHDFNSRAVLLPFLIHLRRSADHSHKVSEIIVVLGQFLRVARTGAQR
jgi:hypothetical protein